MTRSDSIDHNMSNKILILKHFYTYYLLHLPRFPSISIMFLALSPMADDIFSILAINIEFLQAVTSNQTETCDVCVAKLSILTFIQL